MYCTDEKVLVVLNAPIEMASAEIGRQLGICRETVRKIRVGKSFADLFPGVERLTMEQMSQSCEDCMFFKRTSKRVSHCDFSYPEATNTRFARGCAAYKARAGE